MKPEDFVIVIGREFGCGAREVGKSLAQKLGIPYYDRNLLAEAASTFGFKQEIFDHADERRPSLLRSLISGSYTSGTCGSQTLSEERLYEAQSKVIRRLVESNPCVIVGRTADYIGRHLPNMVSIFLHSPVEERAKRIVERGDCPDIKKAASLAHKRDKLRQSYYNYFTGQQWGSASNYHLSIDVSSLSPQSTVDMIITYLSLLASRRDPANKDMTPA